MNGQAADRAAASPGFVHVPDPAMPGWWTWELDDRDCYNAMFGALRIRPEGDGQVRLRLWPERRHTNAAGALHGGLLAGLADVALFGVCQALGLMQAHRAATIDLSVQYLAPGRADLPVDALGEVLRETGRLVFLRGLIVQDEDDRHRVAAFSGTIRKPAAGAPRAP